MQPTVEKKPGKVPWILLAVAGGVALAGILAAVFLPVLVVRWLGGEDFRKLASGQISDALKTKGDLEVLQWSSFSVYSGSFLSRTNDPGDWNWRIHEIRADISPRLLLDRILRFSEISVGSVVLAPGFPAPATTATAPVTPPDLIHAKSSQELLRDVQIEKLEVRNFDLSPNSITQGWGVKGVRIVLNMKKQGTDFRLQNGEILAPLPWARNVTIQQAKGRFVVPTCYLTDLTLKSGGGGLLSASGNFTTSPSPLGHGRFSWERWEIPSGKLGFGLFDVPAKMSGEFNLEEWSPSSLQGSGKVRLVDARLEPGRGSESILAILSVITGEPRLKGCPLTTAGASFEILSNRYDIRDILVEAPGLLRATGSIRISSGNLEGAIQFGLDKYLGSKVADLTGGELFQKEENGYLYQPVKISGTMENPQNDLQPRLAAAMARTMIRTGAQILEKAAGARGGDPSRDATGQVFQGIRSLFAPPSNP